MRRPSTLLFLAAAGSLLAAIAMPAETGTASANVTAPETIGSFSALDVQRVASAVDADAYWSPHRVCGFDADGIHYGKAYLREDGTTFMAFVEGGPGASITAMEASEFKSEKPYVDRFILTSVIQLVLTITVWGSATRAIITMERLYLSGQNGWERLTASGDPDAMACGVPMAPSAMELEIVKSWVFDFVLFRGASFALMELFAGCGGSGLLGRRIGL